MIFWKRTGYLFAAVLWLPLAAAQPEPLRIVSLAPSNTAIVRDLGLGSALYGITTFCIRPKDADHADLIGTITHPNIERITTLAPTLVLGNVESNRMESLDKMESLSLPLLRLGPTQSLQDIIRDVRRVAEMTNRRTEAEALIERATTHLRKIQTLLKEETPKNVFVEIWPKPLTTVSKQGFIHHVVRMAGGKNLFANAPAAYPQISMESVIAQQPEAIFILTHSLISDERIKKYREFPQLSGAVIHQTDASELSQPSLSAFVKAVEHFARVLHPSLEIPSIPLLQEGAR